MPITYTTSDGCKIVLDKGGEFLPSNTYGFEIEFCTHDCPVFAFTHVLVGTIHITFAGETEPFKWKIETDSGNVLEVVTNPLAFETPQNAYDAKKKLTDFLISSVKRVYKKVDDDEIVWTPWPELGVDAVTFDEWSSFVTDNLPKLAQEIYGKNDRPRVEVRLAAATDIEKELTTENVDDGINIKAARLRFEKNSDNWVAYVNATTVGWSEKDWGVGYSSQVNMPMTLAGYFLYFVQRKLRDGHPLRNQDKAEDTKLEQRIQNWFWRTAVAKVCNFFITKLSELSENVKIPAIDIYKLDVDLANKLTMEALKWYAFVYLVANKILTGALGSMSEENQRKLQSVAWEQESTMAMSYPDLLQKAGIDEFLYWRDWLGYHSYLKDLTGLWFKAALQDVAAKEKLSQDGLTALGRVLGSIGGTIWKEALSTCLDDLENLKKEPKVEALDTTYAKGLTNDLTADDGNFLKAVAVVQEALASKIPEFASQEPFKLPEPRKFLHYSEAPKWEGRFDTMWEAFSHKVGEASAVTTYLIEHRFN